MSKPGVRISPHRINEKIPKFPQKSLFKFTENCQIFHLSNLMEPVQVCSKLKRSDIAAETLETLPGMNDINTQIQIRSIISAPVLHPTIAPPPVSSFSNGDWEGVIGREADNN